MLTRQKEKRCILYIGNYIKNILVSLVFFLSWNRVKSFNQEIHLIKSCNAKDIIYYITYKSWTLLHCMAFCLPRALPTGLNIRSWVRCPSRPPPPPPPPRHQLWSNLTPDRTLYTLSPSRSQGLGDFNARCEGNPGKPRVGTQHSFPRISPYEYSLCSSVYELKSERFRCVTKTCEKGRKQYPFIVVKLKKRWRLTTLFIIRKWVSFFILWEFNLLHIMAFLLRHR
jgi:hypothetical protein